MSETYNSCDDTEDMLIAEDEAFVEARRQELRRRNMPGYQAQMDGTYQPCLPDDEIHGTDL